MTVENTIARSLRGDSRQWLDKIFIAAATIFFFLLPIQTRWIFRAAPLYEWGTLSLYGIEILGWVVIALGLFSRYRHSERSEESPAHASTHIRVGSLASLGMTLVGLALLSIIWASDKAVALQAAVRLLEGVLLYVVLSNPSPQSSPTRGEEAKEKSLSLDGRGQGEGVMWAFLVGAVLQALLGIFQFLTQSTFASTLLGMAVHNPAVLGTAVVEAGGARWLRAYGGLPHPNVFGGYLAVALAMLMKLMQCHSEARSAEESPTNVGSRIRARSFTAFRMTLFFVCFLFLITGIFFSFSRAAWLAGIGLLSYWVIKSLKDFIKFRHFDRAARRVEKSHTTYSEEIPRLRFTPLGMTILYLVLLVIVYRPLVVARVFPESHLEVKSRVERVQGVREAWEIVKRHPVVGVGIGNYTQAVARELRSRQSLYTYQPVHNVPLLIWAELGSVGFILFIGTLWQVFFRCHSEARSAEESRTNVRSRIRAGSLAPLGMTLGVLLLFDHYLWTLPFGILLFWAILGLSTYHPQEGT